MSIKYWTKEDIEDLKFGVSLKLSFKEIAECMDRTYNAVKQKAHNLKIKSLYEPEYTKEDRYTIEKMLDNGKSHKDISIKLGRSIEGIRVYCHKNKIYSKNYRLDLKTVEDRIPNDILMLDTYTAANNIHSFKHSKCGTIWKTTASSIFSGSGCPLCNKSSNIQNRTEDTYLYLVYFPTLNLYKIGITIFKDLIKRFKPDKYPIFETIMLIKYSSGKEAFEREQQLLYNIRKYAVNTGKLLTGNTETFRY